MIAFVRDCTQLFTYLCHEFSKFIVKIKQKSYAFCFPIYIIGLLFHQEFGYELQSEFFGHQILLNFAFTYQHVRTNQITLNFIKNSNQNSLPKSSLLLESCWLLRPPNSGPVLKISTAILQTTADFFKYSVTIPNGFNC